MSDWTHIRAFLATAESGSLSAAARKLQLTQPTVSRQVAALEDELGVMLFERLGRALHLTDAGREMLVHARQMGAAADAFALTATSQAQDIEGLVRITASDIFSVYLLPRALHILAERAPRLRIEVIADNGLRDLMRREADIAIRHVEPTQPDLVARRIQQARAYLYASERYIQNHGAPQSLQDCSTHSFIGFGDIDRMMAFLHPIGIELSPENFHFGSNSGLVGWEMVRQGFGIAVMASEAGDHTPGMVRLLPEMEVIEFPVWLTTHRELHTSRKIRLVFDVLAEVLGRKE
ncbi:LysR family transcriptional regulator [Epibacterium sp. SM1969]|uniref:LysR family transcriptional regulator n=1 Tax=Tritonibacter aquimaris TaxID=2663379 RepID=A0A844AX13_9RHOB|nr:LysR family transcriptional regulator [Tritonibacter aquimaris]MQY42462.1 LysR family transcriptional regulator [Tritonibacter aquimaris]